MEVIIRGREFSTSEEIHDYLMKQLEFPDYYGKNLDALYDCLTEISEDTYIEISMEDIDDEEIYQCLDRIWQVLCDASEENFCLDVVRIEP